MNRPEYELMYRLEDSHWWFVGRQHLALALIDRWIDFSPNARILDVGCGTGSNVKALSAHGRAAGLDLSPIALELACRRNLPDLVQGSSLSLPCASHSFELVTTFDVLYHRWITDDVAAIAELYRVLRPGGWLLITDSALPWLWSSHDEVYQARQRYTLGDLRVKLKTVGFEPRFCSYANMLLLPLFILVRLTMDWLPVSDNVDRQGAAPRWLNRLLTRIRMLEAAWLRWGRTLPIGSSLVCLAQKPLA